MPTQTVTYCQKNQKPKKRTIHELIRFSFYLFFFEPQTRAFNLKVTLTLFRPDFSSMTWLDDAHAYKHNRKFIPVHQSDAAATAKTFWFFCFFHLFLESWD